MDIETAVATLRKLDEEYQAIMAKRTEAKRAITEVVSPLRRGDRFEMHGKTWLVRHVVVCNGFDSFPLALNISFVKLNRDGSIEKRRLQRNIIVPIDYESNMHIFDINIVE